MDAQEQIFQILFEKDDVTWQTLILELIKTEQMDPWDVDVSLLTQRYLDMLKKLKELDFRVSGKVLLAAAILLRIKSSRLVGEDLEEFDKLFETPEEEEAFYEELEQQLGERYKDFVPPDLIPRAPQPRKRKVSVYDLMAALHQALEVKKRRVIRSIPPISMHTPTKQIDITQIIKSLYDRISGFFAGNPGQKLTFTNLIPSEGKRDKVLTFIPLLHLTNQRKVDLYQQEHFGEIEVVLRTQELIDKELAELKEEEPEPQLKKKKKGG